jgi:hypothetical protein
MKTTIRKWVRHLPLAIALLAAATASAHHSHSNLDMDDIRTYSGVVTRYSWTMPHVFLKVKAPNEQGEIVEYSIEMVHPPGMAKRGWTKKTFKPGDRITWEGPHDRREGRHYTGLRWAERGDGERFAMEEMAESDVVASTDFTGLWKRSDIGGFNPHYKPPTDWPLSAVGQELVDNFHQDQNPMVACGNPGPPKAMIVPYPVMITRADDNTYIFERELMRDVRVIHLDQDSPAGEPSKLGHSIAILADGELVVETNNFSADKWGSHTGIDSSEQKQLLERFSLSEDGLFLLAEITVTDPVYLTEPVTFIHRWKKLADREVIQAPCTMESAKLYLEGGLDTDGAR